MLDYYFTKRNACHYMADECASATIIYNGLLSGRDCMGYRLNRDSEQAESPALASLKKSIRFPSNEIKMVIIDNQITKSN